jgi:predicted small lipoprotein YifL
MKLYLAPKHNCYAVVLLVAVGLLPGCGQYGDLYLPEAQPETPPETEPAPRQPAPPANKPQDKDPQQAED